DVPHATQEHWSGKRRIGISPVNADSVYIFLTARTDDKAALPEVFEPGPWVESFPHLEHVIERITDSRVDQTFSYVYAKKWVEGRVVILGDAAHCMEPNLGQGA